VADAQVSASLLLASLTFLCYFVLYNFAFWFPTMLKRQSGLSDVHVGLLDAAPYLATFVAMQVNGWHSHKSRERRWHAAVPLFIAATGAFGLLSRPSSIPLSVVWFPLVCTSYAYLPTCWAIPTELLGHSAAAAGSGNDQFRWQCGFHWALSIRLLEHTNGILSYGLALMMISGIAGGLLILCNPRRAQSMTRSAR